MRIGIDISQMAYPGTGVANYLQNLVESLIEYDKENEYILFYSSLRKNFQFSIFNHPAASNFQTIPIKSESNNNVTMKQFRFPPTLLDLLWNRLHIVPIEWFIGDVDVFISSDWTQPPSKAKKMTILYDLIIYKYPDETAKKIIDVQKRKLKWVKKEVDKVLCISEATKKDAKDILGISEEKLSVVYPGI